jgi:hypothetical protein
MHPYDPAALVISFEGHPWVIEPDPRQCLTGGTAELNLCAVRLIAVRAAIEKDMEIHKKPPGLAGRAVFEF